jgi:integrase
MPKHAEPLTARDIATVVQIAKGEKPRHDGALKKGIAKLYDGAGLFVEAAPNGSTFWRLKHSGGRKTDTLGSYPEMSLKEAREAAIKSRSKIAQGIDPVEEKRQKRQERKAAQVNLANTFQVKAEKWLDENPLQLEPSTVLRHRRRLEVFVYPKLGSRPIDEINGLELLDVLNLVVEKKKAHTAERIRQLCSQIFQDKATIDVAGSIKRKIRTPKKKPLPAIKDPKKFAALLRAIDGYEGSALTAAALKLLPMVFTRPGELRRMEWSELDLDTATWVLPESKMKTRESDPIVPLSKQAVELLRSLKPHSGENQYVFPGRQSENRPMSENTINAALRALGYDTQTVHCSHGFRKSASSILNGERFKKDGTKFKRWDADVIEKQLAHAIKGVRGDYNLNDYIEERREMMQDWSDYIDQIKA